MEWLGQRVDTTAVTPLSLVYFIPLKHQAHMHSDDVVPGTISTVPSLRDMDKPLSVQISVQQSS